jgi:hypothetical protein
LNPLLHLPPARLVAGETNATNRPVSEADGSLEAPLLGVLADFTETRVVGPAMTVLLARMKQNVIESVSPWFM